MPLQLCNNYFYFFTSDKSLTNQRFLQGWLAMSQNQEDYDELELHHFEEFNRACVAFLKARVRVTKRGMRSGETEPDADMQNQTRTMKNDALELLRSYWQPAPPEERYALKITASLFERDIEPEIREIRLAAHKRRFETKNYTI